MRSLIFFTLFTEKENTPARIILLILVCRIFCMILHEYCSSQVRAAEPYWTKRAMEERASERSESPFARDFPLTDLTSLLIK